MEERESPTQESALSALQLTIYRQNSISFASQQLNTAKLNSHRATACCVLQIVRPGGSMFNQFLPWHLSLFQKLKMLELPLLSSTAAKLQERNKRPCKSHVTLPTPWQYDKSHKCSSVANNKVRSYSISQIYDQQAARHTMMLGVWQMWNKNGNDNKHISDISGVWENLKKTIYQSLEIAS